jgi:hypothetical protein
MEIEMKKILTILLLLFGVSISPGLGMAGSIDSPGPPSAGSGMITTQQLHDYLTTGETPPEPGNFTEPVAGPGSTGKSTQEVYEGIKTQFDDCQDAAPEDVRSGKTFFSTDPDAWGPTAGQLNTGKGVGETCSSSSECQMGTVCARAYARSDDSGIWYYCSNLTEEPRCVSIEDSSTCLSRFTEIHNDASGREFFIDLDVTVFTYRLWSGLDSSPTHEWILNIYF